MLQRHKPFSGRRRNAVGSCTAQLVRCPESRSPTCGARFGNHEQTCNHALDRVNLQRVPDTAVRRPSTALDGRWSPDAPTHGNAVEVHKGQRDGTCYLKLSRRSAAAAVACSTLLGILTPRALAENGPLPRSCGSAESGAAQLLVPYTDPAGRFRLARPCGWTQVTRLLPGSSVLASFYNPEEPGAETLAVYQAAAPEGARDTRDLGSPQAFASRLAAIAPNGVVQDAYGISHGGLSYLVAHVQFGGNTAGMFGSAREFRAVAVHEGVQYTLRVTTTRYRYLALPEVREWIRGAADSFELLTS